MLYECWIKWGVDIKTPAYVSKQGLENKKIQLEINLGDTIIFRLI